MRASHSGSFHSSSTETSYLHVECLKLIWICITRNSFELGREQRTSVFPCLLIVYIVGHVIPSQREKYNVVAWEGVNWLKCVSLTVNPWDLRALAFRLTFKMSTVSEGVCFCAGVIVLLSLAFLMPLFFYIPKASLAAVIICAVSPMIDFRVPVQLWRVKSETLQHIF